MTETIICAPMRVEARAIRQGLRASENPRMGAQMIVSVMSDLH